MRIVTILTVMAVLQLGAFAGPIILVADFSDPHQYGTLDLGTGVFAGIGTTDAGEIFNGPGNSLYAFRENGDFVKVAHNGATTFVSNPGFAPDEPAGLMDGTIYTSDIATHKLYMINALTGAATLVGSTGLVDPLGGVVVLTLIAGQTNLLYGIATSYDPDLNVIDHAKLYRIDRSTGAATFLTGVTDDAVTCALIVNGVAYVFDFTAQISTLNLSTGVTSPVYDLSGSLNGINGVALTTPEPSTWWMMLLASGGLPWVRRRWSRAGRTENP